MVWYILPRRESERQVFLYVLSRACLGGARIRAGIMEACGLDGDLGKALAARLRE